MSTQDVYMPDDVLTLRDKFAIAALQGLLSGNDEMFHVTTDKTAQWSYEYADAMLKARKL